MKNLGIRAVVVDVLAQGRHAVEAHADAGVPHDHVGDAQRALHQLGQLVALLDVLPPAGLGAAAAVALAGDGLLDGLDLLVGVRLDLDGVVGLALPGLLALGADHEAVLARQHRAADGAEDLAEPLVDGACRRTGPPSRSPRRGRCGARPGCSGRSGFHHSRCEPE